MKAVSALRIVVAAWIGITLGLASGVQATVVIATGTGSGFAAPHPPYGPDRPLELELTIGYTGVPATTVGKGVWIAEPGVYELSIDTNLNTFLGYATNGIADPMTVHIQDRDGFSSIFEFGIIGGRAERELLGGNPDLAHLEPVGLQLRLELVELSPTSGEGGVLVRWETLGVPEPSSIVLAGVLVLRFFSRKRPFSEM